MSKAEQAEVIAAEIMEDLQTALDEIAQIYSDLAPVSATARPCPWFLGHVGPAGYTADPVSGARPGISLLTA